MYPYSFFMVTFISELSYLSNRITSHAFFWNASGKLGKSCNGMLPHVNNPMPIENTARSGRVHMPISFSIHIVHLIILLAFMQHFIQVLWIYNLNNHYKSWGWVRVRVMWVRVHVCVWVCVYIHWTWDLLCAKYMLHHWFTPLRQVLGPPSYCKQGTEAVLVSSLQRVTFELGMYNLLCLSLGYSRLC